MKIHFATCNREVALEFLQKLYPSTKVEDTPEDAGPLLDLVEKDIVRIQDPNYHNPAKVIPATHWAEASRDDFMRICQEFHNKH